MRGHDESNNPRFGIRPTGARWAARWLAIDFICTNDFDHKQLRVALKKSLLFTRRAKAQVLLLVNLHGMSRGKLYARLPQISEDVFKDVEVSLPFFMSDRMRCEVRQVQQGRSIGAHPYAGYSFHL